MKRLRLKIMKFLLSRITSIAFAFILLNINTTCCGPAYQPILPSEVDSLRRYKEDA